MLATSSSWSCNRFSILIFKGYITLWYLHMLKLIDMVLVKNPFRLEIDSFWVLKLVKLTFNFLLFPYLKLLFSCENKYYLIDCKNNEKKIIFFNRTYEFYYVFTNLQFHFESLSTWELKRFISNIIFALKKCLPSTLLSNANRINLNWILPVISEPQKYIEPLTINKSEILPSPSKFVNLIDEMVLFSPNL